MVQVRLLDQHGYSVGTPNVPDELPRVVVWGDDFFLLNYEDVRSGEASPRYYQVSGFVVTDTREGVNFT